MGPPKGRKVKFILAHIERKKKKIKQIWKEKHYKTESFRNMKKYQKCIPFGNHSRETGREGNNFSVHWRDLVFLFFALMGN